MGVVSSETREDVTPGTEQGLDHLAWTMVTVVVAVDTRGMIAFAFRKHGGSGAYGMGLRDCGEDEL